MRPLCPVLTLCSYPAWCRFVTARKRAPAIIFIDEIDAIGRARSAMGGDPGSMERESALLAMLVQVGREAGTGGQRDWQGA